MDAEEKYKVRIQEYMKNRLKRARTFDNLDAAKRAGIQANHMNNKLFSVWKEPANMGGRYALIPVEDREIACRMGYKIVVHDYELYKQFDEIKEL